MTRTEIEQRLAQARKERQQIEQELEWAKQELAAMPDMLLIQRLIIMMCDQWVRQVEAKYRANLN